MAYQTISNIFSKNESDLTASEAHGLATGMLCIENKTEVTSWLAELFPEDVTVIEEDNTILVSLCEQTRKLLNEEDTSFSYDLFLPGDDEEISVQLEAIRYWCEGFLFGVGYSNSSSNWPGETGEVMKDIVEFTKMDSEVEDDMDEDEKEAYDSGVIEIQEYLRVAVLTIRDQFLEASNGQQSNN